MALTRLRSRWNYSFISSFFLISLLFFPVCHASSFIVDLSYAINDKTPTNPLIQKFNLRVVTKGLNKFGNWIEMNDFFSTEHSGTHIDAPVHYNKNGKSVDLLPLNTLYRVPGVKIDLQKKLKYRLTHNYEIKPSDIQEWIAVNGDLPDGGVLLFQTGWGKKAFNPRLYSGMDNYGKLNFPGIGMEAAKWIVEYKNKTGQSMGVIGVGIDAISFDVGQDIRTPAHVILLGAGLYGLENLANLDQLPARGFTLTILPMKIALGSGGPTRIVAEIDGVPFTSRRTASSSTRNQNNIWIYLILFALFRPSIYYL